jgi:hypothetical protein
MVGRLLTRLFQQKFRTPNVTLLKYLQDSGEMPAGKPLNIVTIAYVLSLVSVFCIFVCFLLHLSKFDPTAC